MKTVGLAELCRWLGNERDVRCVGAARDVTLTGVAVDSRSVQPGDLFIAARGECADSHAFIPEAIQRGASAILAERSSNERIPQILIRETRDAVGAIASYFLEDPCSRLRLIGVTGTNGKTTTARCLWRILSLADGTTGGMLGTVENILGRDDATGDLITRRPLTTTPGPLDLHAAFHEMVRAGARSCVMEVSSHGIVQKRVAGVTFQAAVLVNITSDHLDYHGSFEAYREAKTLLFSGLPETSVAILNRDDASYDFVKERTRARVVPFSPRGWPGLTRCRVHTAGSVEVALGDREGAVEITTQLWGRHNAENLLAAVCCARSLGVGWGPIAEGLRGFRPPPGRLEEVPAPGFRVFVDYAHTASALSEVLQSIRPAVNGGRLILVFGCGGDRDRSKRPEMGRIAFEKADCVVITSDNPRTEKPQLIIGEILLGVPRGGENIHVEEDRQGAIRLALAMARAGDVVLIAGKGHEDYQVIGRDRVDFDDRAVARDVLMELRDDSL